MFHLQGSLQRGLMLSPDFVAENLVNKIIGNKIFKAIVPVEQKKG